MKDISIYFAPVAETIDRTALGETVLVHDEHGFPEISEAGVAILMVPEYRNGGNEKATSSGGIREAFYSLYKGDGWNFALYDLGTILPGKSVDDTYFALSQVVTELIKKNVVPIVLGGSQDLTLALYKGFESLEQMINVCAIDSKLDIGSPETSIQSDGFVSHLLLQRPCYLFNYAVIGVQRPFVRRDDMQLFEKLYFDVCRLGEYTSNPKIAEPHLRNSDILSIDVSAVKASETDEQYYKNPNGFYAEDMCQLARYAGLSDKLSCVGIFNIHPNQNGRADQLIAQTIWYYLDGFAQRVGDFPIGSRKNYVKFNVHMEDVEEDLVFYKSDKSGRWWLEVKYPAGESGKYERLQLVPCDREDYEAALNNVIPNLWWKTLQKLV